MKLLILLRLTNLLLSRLNQIIPTLLLEVRLTILPSDAKVVEVLLMMLLSVIGRTIQIGTVTIQLNGKTLYQENNGRLNVVNQLLSYLRQRAWMVLGEYQNI